MNELQKLGEKTYVLLASTNIGFYLLNDNEVCLIDSGSSKDSAKQIDKILINNNWHLKYIINTHSHADHNGGNRYLQEKYNCEIYTSSIESFISANPILEPIMLYSASPLKELCNHLLMAKPSISKDVANLNLDGISIIDLKGHTLGQIGIVTSDNVCFVGDAYTSSRILNKYTIQYTFDIEAFLKTLDYLLTTNYAYYVPSHGEIEKNPQETINMNKETTLKIEDIIIEMVKEPKTINQILEDLFTRFHISNNLTQYHLISATLKAYITKLNNMGKVNITFNDGNMIITEVYQNN